MGGNSYGQLGLGDIKERLTPTRVPGLTGVKAIAAGGDHSLALTESGEVYAWGGNSYGQLGLGDGKDRLTPTKVPGLTGVKAIAAGGDHSLALTEAGEVYAWGGNSYGQLGLGDIKERLTPTRVPGLTGVKAIAAGGDHSLALTESGEVYGGVYRSALTELGDTATYTWKVRSFLLPIKLPVTTKVKAIAAGSDYSLALTESGEVYAWGWSYYGQCRNIGLGNREQDLLLTPSRNIGLGNREQHLLLTPTRVAGLAKVKAIAAGSDHSLVLTEAGEVYACGDNQYGQLGLGDREGRLTPVRVPGLP
jgi:alpha-tubulin suppressor-like RCC1 family protein